MYILDEVLQDHQEIAHCSLRILLEKRYFRTKFLWLLYNFSPFTVHCRCCPAVDGTAIVYHTFFICMLYAYLLFILFV